MPKSILIVDDEPRITAALVIRLQTCGYVVFHALNGMAGVEAAALHEPDIVVMDIRMPDIDGFDACTRIKRLPYMQNTPILFLSANARDDLRQRALEAGAAMFLSKPYVAADVMSAIETLITQTPARLED